MWVLSQIWRLIVGYRPGDYAVGQPVKKHVNCWICGGRASAIFRVSDRDVGLCQRHDPRSQNPAEDWVYMWEIAPDDKTLGDMREYGCKFAAYQNTDTTHSRRGELRFLRYGYKNNFYAVPPDLFPVADEDGVHRYIDSSDTSILTRGPFTRTNGMLKLRITLTALAKTNAFC
jgi:hypothetical protein